MIKPPATPALASTPVPERPDSDERQRRPALGPAIVSGGCAVAVALITGLFNWINRPAPASPSPAAAISEQPAAPPQEIRTAGLDSPPMLAIPTRPEPIYALNFAAFQSVVRNTSLAPETRQKAAARVVGNAVLWQGYVAKVVANEPTDRGLIGTIVLIEDPLLVTQTLLPYAAYCRFNSDPDGHLTLLQPGQSITIRGDCTRHTAIGTEIENCAVVDAAAR